MAKLPAKGWIFIFASLLVALLASACGGTASTGTSYGGSSASTTDASSTAVIKTSDAVVDGKSTTILTNAQDKALYVYADDTDKTSGCTGACATNWPPLLFSGSGSPGASTTLPGKLTVVKNVHGQQVTYNGHFLYTFAGDTAPKQVNGEGKAGKWFVATPDLKAGAIAPMSTGAANSASAGGTAVIKTSMASVKGKSETILTDAKGMTLYYFTQDTASKTACTGSCVGAWPALLFSGSGQPMATAKLPGELEVYKNANGNQVIYNDHPLYTFSGDTAPGQTNGEGVGGQWHVATPALAKNAS
ncbi:hypothetical protein [Ktedonosporobacter rubrisoli]|nr:hypothetical protein [Ktedonosporobacter rubrisoli]